LNLRSKGSGGLEHLNSTALIWPRFGFGSASDYLDFLSSLVAHEFFHLWNVKRIRPDALGPFDYTRENYTKLLWVAEGLTSYYQSVFLQRAGLISDRDFLNATAKEIQDLQNTPGRLVMSAEEASFDAWIKFYRQDENSVNSQISYYDKGAILGLLLDLHIRKRSQGARSLDDVMRYLYTEYYQKGRNYTPEDFQRAAELAAGASLEDFFARYVRGREELDYNAALAGVGLRLNTTAGGSPESPLIKTAYLGVKLKQDNDRLIVEKVYSGTPAYDQGLNADDQIVALDNMRVNLESINARLAEKRPGETITLTVFRFDDLRTLTIKLGERINADYRIEPVKQPSAEQARLYQGWLGAPLPR
jgi:predicted metalloprotease with PDZ domain